MINAIGISTSLTYDLDFNEKVCYQSHDGIIELIETKRVIDVHNKPALELTCKYSIYLPDDPNCKSLQDYASHVFPFLSFKLRRLIRNETYKLTQVDAPFDGSNSLHISEVIKKLPL